MTPTTSVGNGRYSLSEHIATGGMGEVWRAVDTVLGRDVAVKILKSEYAGDPTFRARLEAEARNTAALHHPGIAQVFDYGEVPVSDEGRATAFLVMELVAGEPLSAVLAREGALPPDRAADVVAQAAAAVEVAHQQGIVHRDVKPANLIVTPTGAVKVTDFGIARAADAVPLTQTGQVIGTPHYLAPEQARGLPATAATDVYALGVVLYECLTGGRPFTGEPAVAVAMQHLRDPVPPLPDTLPAGLAGICMTAMAKEPAERQQSAGELAAQLRDPDGAAVTPPATAGLAAGGVAAGAAGGTALMTSPGTPAEPGHAAPPPRRRRGWLPPLAAAVAVLLLIGGLALALSGEDGGPGGTAGDGPSPQPSQTAPHRVRVDPADYLGRPYPDARADLRADGLRVDRVERVGDGGEPGTVAYVRPHGSLPAGSTVTLGVWQAPPEEAPAEDGGGEPQPAPKEEKPDKGDKAPKDNGKGKSKGDDKGKKKDDDLLDLSGSSDSDDDDGED